MFSVNTHDRTSSGFLQSLWGPVVPVELHRDPCHSQLRTIGMRAFYLADTWCKCNWSPHFGAELQAMFPCTLCIADSGEILRTDEKLPFVPVTTLDQPSHGCVSTLAAGCAGQLPLFVHGGKYSELDVYELCVWLFHIDACWHLAVVRLWVASVFPGLFL